jgi:hypothetical protein
MPSKMTLKQAIKHPKHWAEKLAGSRYSEQHAQIAAWLRTCLKKPSTGIRGNFVYLIFYTHKSTR